MDVYRRLRPTVSKPEFMEEGSDGRIEIDYKDVMEWEDFSWNCTHVIDDLGHNEPKSEAHVVLLVNTRALAELVKQYSVSVLCSHVDINEDLFLVEVLKLNNLPCSSQAKYRN